MHRHTERQSGNVFLKVCQHCTTRTSFTLAFYCSAAILHIGGPTDSVDATAPQSATAAASLSNSQNCVVVVQQQQSVPAILKFWPTRTEKEGSVQLLSSSTVRCPACTFCLNSTWLKSSGRPSRAYTICFAFPIA